MIEYSTPPKPKDKRRSSGSALKCFVMFLWHGLGVPGMWVFLMFAIVIAELVYGTTLMGSFWVAVCLIAYFLSRIAHAIEKIGGLK